MNRQGIKIHLIYVVIIIFLLIIVGSLTINKIFEKDVAIRTKDGSETYTLRMLSSGDLVFEKHRFLPLASFHDYWGDMNVLSVEWLGKDQVNITMSDGTRLDIKMGQIEVKSPNKAN